MRREFTDAARKYPAFPAALDTVDGLNFDVVSQIRMDTWSRRRAALIGDAAACISLPGGEGNGLAVPASHVMADELHCAGGVWRVAFERYEPRLRPVVHGKQAGAERFPRSSPRTRDWATGCAIRRSGRWAPGRW